MSTHYEDGDDEDTGMGAGCAVLAIIALALVVGLACALVYPQSDIFWKLLVQ